MIINSIIEDYRVQSILTEGMHVVQLEDQESLTCFGGIVVPLRIALVLAIWVKTAGKFYTKLIRDEDVSLIQALNNKKFKSDQKDVIIHDLYLTMANLGNKWIDNNIDSFVIQNGE